MTLMLGLIIAIAGWTINKKNADGLPRCLKPGNGLEEIDVKSQFQSPYYLPIVPFL
ncbi:hypothetical protein F3157_00365 [Virgibacillus dakarensis]|nr:hypothetical protein [Virgibacillus dakarensis]